ncbi:hypothetical protein [Dehalobacterium formicoaceticum]|uniref:CBM6 domain-containing protein n=1 Tax=Dehalobacterium formicoaceticum TaxID=51515 RepID=A0ABT1Y0N3_9FIRM|nr:hypothetical protein [Dehalobacterium formicoaceticum]MCR6544427.1 hypothetical protein [Dehalobacterium formicoaceticum]
MMPCHWYGMCPYSQGMQGMQGMQLIQESNEVRLLEEEEEENLQLMRQGPQPILSNQNPSRVLVFRKELTGYPNYGNPSGNADILYTGTQGTWTFNMPPLMAVLLNNTQRIELVIRGALDDHYNVAENRYSATVTFNGQRQNVGQLPFVHGRPAGQQFTNWNELVLNINPRLARLNNRVVIRNTSNVGANDWIALDWMELRFIV